MNPIKLILCVALPVSVAGCVNLEPIGKFADGAQRLFLASAEFYRTELETDRKLAGLTVNLDEPVADDAEGY